MRPLDWFLVALAAVLAVVDGILITALVSSS
jgi:hypothetical protein